MSRISLPNSSRCFSCHASMPGTRNFVRGDTYSPSSSKPPWQRTPPATSGSAMASSASSSCSVYSTCRVVIGQVYTPPYTAWQWETRVIDVAFEVAGVGDPLLLVAGLGQKGKKWRRVVPLLADRYSVVTFD